MTKGSCVHVLEDGAVLVVHDGSVGIAPGQPGDAAEIAALGHVLDGEIELVAGDEIDGVPTPFSVASGSTATLAPIMPIFKLGLSALSASAVFTSEAKEGVDVCSTTSSCFAASAAMSWNFSRCGGASMSFEPSTKAAGWASQVGYQNDWISRRA